MPRFAAVSKAEGALPFGEAVERYAGGVGVSEEEELKVCDNHPESLVGRSSVREVEDVKEQSCDDESSESGAEARGLGIGSGSTITGALPMSVAGGGKGIADEGFLFFSSLIPRNLLVFRVLAMGIEDWECSGDGGAADALFARLVRLPAGSVHPITNNRARNCARAIRPSFSTRCMRGSSWLRGS